MKNKRLGGGVGKRDDKNTILSELTSEATVAASSLSSHNNNNINQDSSRIMGQSSQSSLEKMAEEKEMQRPPPPLHELSGLNCRDHNGPANDIAAEMVYWKDIPSDSSYKSPIIGNNNNNVVGHDRKYLTFEPDGTFFLIVERTSCYVIIFPFSPSTNTKIQ